MKKIASAALALALIFSLTACGSTTATAAAETSETKNVAASTAAETSDPTTITGTVTSIDEDKITITLEDGSETTFTVNDSTTYAIAMPEMPDGDGQAPDNGQQGGNPPEMPQGGQNPGNGQQGGNPPEMPQGGQNSGNGQQGGNPPEKPDGNGQPSDNGQQGGNPPEMPEGDNGMQAGLDMVTEGATITVTLNDDGTAAVVELQMSGDMGQGGPGGGPGGPGGPGGQGGPGGGFGGEADVSYTAVNTYEDDTSIDGQSLSSTGKDENTVLVTAGEVSLSNTTIDRTSAESTGGDNSSFYGVGAAVLTTDGTVNVSGSTITTDAAGGAGVFAYGDGTAYVSDSTITTQEDTSGGIHVAGGGTLYAWNNTVETNGESSAAIRSDRGSGTMVVDGGNYTSNGTGSPAIYSTADISVNNADLTANGSEAVCIEGMNSVRLYDCNLSGNMSDDSRNDCTWNVILYQSMSGDSAEGNSLFEMDGGTLTANNGGVFYTTNTESTFVLSNVNIVTSDDSEYLLKCTGNSNQRGWGSTGANGADCSFSAIGQVLNGDVIWDSISNLDFYMTDGSTLTGAFLQDETNAGNGGNGYAKLNIGEGCTWIVTKDSTLSSLSLSGSIVDASGQSVSVIGTDGTVYISGDSDVVVTVGSFSDTADLTGCGSVSSFSDYAVEKA